MSRRKRRKNVLVFGKGYRVSSDYSCSTCPPFVFSHIYLLPWVSLHCNFFLFPFSLFLARRQEKFNTSHANLAPSDLQSRRKCLVLSITWCFFLNPAIPFCFLPFKEADNLRWAFWIPSLWQSYSTVQFIKCRDGGETREKVKSAWYYQVVTILWLYAFTIWNRSAPQWYKTENQY